MLVEISEHFGSLFVLTLCYEVHCELHEYAAVSVAHSHHCLVKIDARFLKATELEFLHQVVVGALRVEVLCTRCVGGEWCDSVYETFLHEVVAEVHIVLLANSHCHIYRTSPVALCNHLKHHQVALV